MLFAMPTTAGYREFAFFFHLHVRERKINYLNNVFMLLFVLKG